MKTQRRWKRQKSDFQVDDEIIEPVTTVWAMAEDVVSEGEERQKEEAENLTSETPVELTGLQYDRAMEEISNDVRYTDPNEAQLSVE